MAGAGSIIIFVVAMVGCTIWSAIYLIFVAHYFLTTLIDSSNGQDEVNFPSESIAEWWWKPIFCLWILGVFVFPVLVMLTPLLARHPLALVICLGVLLWFLYPIGLLSALYTQNWLFFLHPGIAARMVRHFGAFAYVHLITLLSACLCGGLLLGVFTRSFLWGLPAAFVVPTTLLFYARHWGRFAWMSLNFVPRPKKKRRPLDADIPELEVEEVEPAPDGFRAGLPPAPGRPRSSDAVDKKSENVKAGPSPWTQQPTVAEEDEWAREKKPYQQDDLELPSFIEKTAAPAPSVSMQTTAGPPPEEEEDEWAPVKKPYKWEDPTHPAPPDPLLAAKPEADKPVVLSNYYDEQAEKEKKEQAKKAAATRVMPTRSRKTPTFRSALFFGVWEFMIYRGTLHVWANLVVLTIVELLFLFMVVQFFPALP